MTAAPLVHQLAPVATGSLSPKGGGELHLDLVESTAGFHALEADWRRLAERCVTQTPFMKWEWAALWWDMFQDDFRLAIGVVRDSKTDVVRGIAPLAIGQLTCGARRHLRQIAFLGGLADVVSEGMDFLVARGDEAQITPVLARTFGLMEAHWDAVHLQMMHAESPNVHILVEALKAYGHGAAILDIALTRFIETPRSWEEYENSRSAQWRSRERRKMKKFLSGHQGRVLLAGRDIDYDVAFDEVLRCHGLQWSEGVSHFLRPSAIRFHRRLVHRLAAEGRILILLLEMDGRIGGASYCFVSDHRLWYYQTGWDPEFAAISAGQLVLAETLRWAIDHQLESVELLPGECDYKLRWGKRSRQLIDIECFNPRSARAVAFRSVRGLKRLFTGWNKPTLQMEVDAI